MTTATELPAKHYLNAKKGLASWLFTLDHKRIGVLYLWGILIAFALGGVAAMLMRLELFAPGVPRGKLIATFLALLELIRWAEAKAFQDGSFGAILIFPTDQTRAPGEGPALDVDEPSEAEETPDE